MSSVLRTEDVADRLLAGPLVVAGVTDPRSLGVHRHVERLAAALAGVGVDYRPVRRPPAGAVAHFHLSNSTRAVLPYAARRRDPYVVTLHDVIPRARAFRLVHRAAIVPLCVTGAARVVVHSEHAAELLERTSSIARGRVTVIPLPAPVPDQPDRAAAAARLGLGADGPPLFVLPGVLKAAKLVRETLRAAEPLLAAGQARLLLAGRVADEALASEATAMGAVVLRDPSNAAYEDAIVAADVVLCLRADSVGESNGPLLDAVGATRASLVTDVGSAPGIAGPAAHVVTADVLGIRGGLEALLDDDARRALARAARDVAAELTWARTARRYAELLTEVADA